MVGKRVLCAAIVSGLLCFSTTAFAQAGNASLTGVVRDSSGGSVPNARVAVTNLATGVPLATLTNTAGSYYVPNLIPGDYKVDVAANGFEEETINNIHLVVDQQARIDVEMKLGSVGQTVQVNSAPELLQTEDASVGTVISSQHVVDLPLNGRYFTQLLEVSPGTTTSVNTNLFKTASPSTTGLERNGMPAFDVNGGNAAFVNYRLDGVDNSETEFGGANVPVSVDAIAEVKIQTANFSAEYGRGPAQVDVVMKSGSNQVHGTLFEFLRNDDMDGTQWTITGPHTKNLLKRNQFGGVVGGPVKKDKLFYFFGYDGTRQVLSSPTTKTVPSTDMRNGIFPAGNVIYDPYSQAPFPNNTVPSSRFDSIAQKMLAVVPMPNQAGIAAFNKAGMPIDPTNNFFINPEQRQTINQYNLRVDYHLSNSNSLMGRYTQSSNNILADGLLASNLNSSLVGQEKDNLGGKNLMVDWIHNISPTTINALRFGVSTDPQAYNSVDKTDYASQFGIKQFLNPNALPGLPYITFGTVNLSGGNTRPLTVSETNYQPEDDLTLVRGKHTLKIGFDAYRGYRTPYNVERARGYFAFNGAQTQSRTQAGVGGDATADFLLGYLDFFEAGQATPVVTRHFTSWDSYVQDQWRLTSRLTLNLGLRYEYAGRELGSQPDFAWPVIQNGDFNGTVAVANTSNGQITPLAPAANIAAIPGSVVTCRSVGLPDTCESAQRDKVQPRIGFAWQVTPKTVVRLGGGIFYGHMLGDYETEEADSNYPFVLLKTTLTYTKPSSGTAPPPILLSNPLAGATAPAPSFVVSQPYFKSPSSYQWNLTVERQLTGNMVLSTAYVASLGRHLDTLPQAACCNYNIPQPWGVVLAPGQTQTQAAPKFGVDYVLAEQTNSEYQSLQMKLERRFSRGLGLVTAFTYSKNLTIIPGLTDTRYPAEDKGPADDDVRTNLVISPIWKLPVGAGQHFLNHKGLLNAVVGGWQFSGIFTLRSGFPFTPTLSGDNVLNNSYAYENVPDRICNGSLGNPTVFNWFNKNCFVAPTEPTTPGALLHEGNSGINILRGPHAFGLDMGLTKTFYFGDRFSLDLRGESFNLLNHPIFALPNAAILAAGNSAPAQITSTISLPRTMQVAMKLHF